MKHYVMDYETLSNCFLGVFEDYKKDEVKVFTIGKLRNDIDKLLDFFNENKKLNQWHISFNGLAFDAQITEYIIKHAASLKKLNGEEAAKRIYNKAQDCIKRSRDGEWQEWSEKQLSIKQIDMFKLNHWDNFAKRSSLKWIQCGMRWNNVQDMPIHHTTKIETVEALQEIAMYCRNDVASTKNIMKLCAKEIKLRRDLTDEYDIRLFSASEPRISKELFLYFLEKETGIPKWELKKLRTYRREIHVRDIILPYINFDGVPQFEDLLRNFQDLIINGTKTKGAFSYSVKYRGVKTDFGLGGVHGAKRGVYIPDEHMTIMSSDVVSFYPNLGIRNGWAPAHLPKEAFCKLYEWFFDERKKIPKSDPRNYVYKIILNSTYGLSNDENSFLYDPEFTMRITINGQLSLMMLYTQLAERVPGCIPIMQNTDGVEIMIPKKHIDLYMQIAKEWEEVTNLKLEHDEYEKLIVPDCNNYIGIFKNGKTKCKGRFETEKALHKNASHMIVPKALYEFFVNGTDPKDYIKTNKNIFDYCGQRKIIGNWKFKRTFVTDGIVHTEDLQKTLRYYISNKGDKIIKENIEDGRQVNLEAGKWQQTIFNTFQEKAWEEYDIDYNFYLDKINREIKAMQPELFKIQLSLF
tara:strand:- start:4822 stop:6723 length:1902 start_codon:yes stop_codon:yes gene_type:complete